MNRVLINGEATDTIPASDRGLHYGDGVFETIAFRNGKLQFWDAHLQRMQLGCRRLGLVMPDESQWLDDLRALGIDGDAVVKLILTRGSGGRGYRAPDHPRPTRMVAGYDYPDHDDARRQGVRVRLCDTPVSVNRALAGVKHLNRLDSVLARAEWQDPAVAEGLMCDDAGYVIEGTMSNVFAVQDRRLYTPVLKKCGIAGIVRNRVIEQAAAQGIETHQVDMDVPRLLHMDEVFLTNSVIGIWPVIQLEQTRYQKREITDMLMQQLDMEQGAYALQVD